MPDAHLRQVAMRYYDALNAADDDALARLVTLACQHHVGGCSLDHAAFRQSLVAYRAGFASLCTRVEHLLTENDCVATRTVTSGVHTAPFLGHPATRRAFSAGGSDFLRIEHGRIAEVWSVFDTFGMLRQLGITGETAS
ncbi:MAG: ester cyclase [Alphaproteobacteria bacterium]|nr:MAG: ester cyclase [Alphaproteobacteria bacterium]